MWYSCHKKPVLGHGVHRHLNNSAAHLHGLFVIALKSLDAEHSSQESHAAERSPPGLPIGGQCSIEGAREHHGPPCSSVIGAAIVEMLLIRRWYVTGVSRPSITDPAFHLPLDLDKTYAISGAIAHLS
jgi:hypothetical protein